MERLPKAIRFRISHNYQPVYCPDCGVKRPQGTSYADRECPPCDQIVRYGRVLPK